MYLKFMGRKKKKELKDLELIQNNTVNEWNFTSSSIAMHNTNKGTIVDTINLLRTYDI